MTKCDVIDSLVLSSAIYSEVYDGTIVSYCHSLE